MNTQESYVWFYLQYCIFRLVVVKQNLSFKQVIAVHVIFNIFNEQGFASFIISVLPSHYSANV